MATDLRTGVVLDASVLLAVLLEESSPMELSPLIAGGIMSSVNLSEVLAKAEEFGMPFSAPKLSMLLSLLYRVEPFTARQARLAAELRRSTRSAGLSLGDRACLALAIDLGYEVYTADKQWAQVQVGCKVHLVR